MAVDKKITSESAANSARQYTWATACGLLAGWLAAGSCGLLTASLQTLLVCIFLVAAGLLAAPRYRLSGLMAVAFVLAIVLFVSVTVDSSPGKWPLLVATVLGLIAAGIERGRRSELWAAAFAVLALTLFQIAQTQVPVIWLLSRQISGGLGTLAGRITGEPLQLGASFAGIDFLVAMAAWGVAIFVVAERRIRWSEIGIFAAVVVVAHAAYLALLALTPAIIDRLPPVVQPRGDSPYVPPGFCWSTVARQMLPWNLPFVAALFHAVAACGIMRALHFGESDGSYGDLTVPLGSSRSEGRRETNEDKRWWGDRATVWATIAMLLASLLSPLCTLQFVAPNLQGKQIVANRNSGIDYRVAAHGEYGEQSAGMFGLLPVFIRSLGGEFHSVGELTSENLADQDCLVLLHPDREVARKGELLWNYVREGGALLVVTDGFHPAFGFNSAAADLLERRSVVIEQDTAAPVVSAWQGSLWAAAHPATVAAGRPLARFAPGDGASLRVRWGARPLIVGKWGWSAPQQDAGWADSRPFRTGSRLGDVVLAAEQQVGRGRVVVLGGDWPLTNDGLVKSYLQVGNLLASLTYDSAGAASRWRQIFTLFGFLILPAVVLIEFRRNRRPHTLIMTAVILLVGLAVCSSVSRSYARVVPKGRRIVNSQEAAGSKGIAYIGASHLEKYDMEEWRYDSINGLALNLIRNGFLPLLLPELTSDQLAQASMYVSLAPARRFSCQERRVLTRFVQEGGILVSMVGAEQAPASAALLADFGLRVPHSPVTTGDPSWEPEPLGRTRAWYLEVDPPEASSYRVGMRLHAAWPVESLDGGAEVIAFGRNQLRIVDSDTELPVVLRRPWGRGWVVLIGDSGFALNRNLEYAGGEPLAGGYENALFWRWLLSGLTSSTEWVPPRPAVTGEEPAKQSPLEGQPLEEPKSENPLPENPDDIEEGA